MRKERLESSATSLASHRRPSTVFVAPATARVHEHEHDSAGAQQHAAVASWLPQETATALTWGLGH